jgi:hypothetical protein
MSTLPIWPIGTWLSSMWQMTFQDGSVKILLGLNSHHKAHTFSANQRGPWGLSSSVIGWLSPDLCDLSQKLIYHINKGQLVTFWDPWMVIFPEEYLFLINFFNAIHHLCALPTLSQKPRFLTSLVFYLSYSPNAFLRHLRTEVVVVWLHTN